MLRVGFIGLGSQGAPMARRIIEAGHPTTLWARRVASLEAFADVPHAETPSSLAADCDVVCVCVVNDDDLDAVVAGPSGVFEGLSPGATLIVHSTVHPDTCRRLANLCAAQGCSLLDAPVSGGGGAAAAGRLLVMVGGSTGDVRRYTPLFNSYADRVVHLGGVGAGQVAKLLNNVLLAANLGAAADITALGAALGVDAKPLIGVLRSGSAASFALEVIDGFGGTLDGVATQAGPLLQKDARILISLTDEMDVPRGIAIDVARVALQAMAHPV